MVAVALGRSGHDAADPVGVTASPGCVRRHDCMKTESLRANISRWGYGRTLLAGFMSCLRTYAGVHIYRVNLRPLAPRSVAPPQLPAGISLCIVPPPKLLDAAKDPELDMESGFVRAALGRGDVAFGAFDGDQLIAYVWRPFGAAPSSFRVLARNRLIRLWHSHSHCSRHTGTLATEADARVHRYACRSAQINATRSLHARRRHDEKYFVTPLITTDSLYQ